MTKKQYLYSNLFAWGLVLLLITNYVYGWTIPSQNPPGGNIVLETGATPAGSTGYIQFNDNGNLGADSNLFWDNTNKYLGVGTANPGAKLEVNGNIITSAPTADNHVVTKSYVDSNFTKVDSVSATNLAVGWYTIAVNSGNRAIARFGLRDTASGRHQSIIFYASHHYGSSSELTVIHNGRYGSLAPYKYIRIKEGSTYDGALLQVYLSNSTNNLVAYLLGDNIQDHGWVLKNFIPDGTDPGGVGNFSALTNVAVQVDIEEILNGGMYTSGNIVASAPIADNHVATKAYVDSTSAGQIELYCDSAWRAYGDAAWSLANGVMDTAGNQYILESDGFVYKNGSRIVYTTRVFTNPTVGGYKIYRAGSGNDTHNEYCQYCVPCGINAKTYTTTGNESQQCYRIVANCTCDAKGYYNYPYINSLTCNIGCTQIRW